MYRFFYFFTALCIGLCGALHADSNYLVVTASNDANDNQLLVYDANGKQIQSISTKGKGGVDPNMVGGGVNNLDNYIAVINHNSQSVSLFKREGDNFKLLQVIPTLSKPVSIDFGYDHIYILGTTTIESHKMKGDQASEKPDGSKGLFVGDGSGAQVGVLPNQLIISERSNTLELADLNNGAVKDNISAIQLPAPPDNKVPVGLVTRGDKAYVTIAHSDIVGLVKDGKLIKTVKSFGGQHVPCWLALTGTWLYATNTPSRTISLYKVEGDNITPVEAIVAQTKGGPSDIDADGDIVAVLDTGNGLANISQYQVDSNGKLKLLNSTQTAGTANGVAIVRKS